MYKGLYAAFWEMIKSGTLRPVGNFWFIGSDAEEDLVKLAQDLKDVEASEVFIHPGMVELHVNQTFIESGGATA